MDGSTRKRKDQHRQHEPIPPPEMVQPVTKELQWIRCVRVERTGAPRGPAEKRRHEIAPTVVRVYRDPDDNALFAVPGVISKALLLEITSRARNADIQ